MVKHWNNNENELSLVSMLRLLNAGYVNESKRKSTKENNSKKKTQTRSTNESDIPKNFVKVIYATKDSKIKVFRPNI